MREVRTPSPRALAGGLRLPEHPKSDGHRDHHGDKPQCQHQASEERVFDFPGCAGSSASADGLEFTEPMVSPTAMTWLSRSWNHLLTPAPHPSDLADLLEMLHRHP
jgi:hypothetical protein